MAFRIRAILLASVAASFFWIISKLWRYETVRYPLGLDGSDPVLYAHWHGDELALISEFGKRHLAVMVSRSKDGEMLQHVLHWLGYHVVRGSSSRGGAGGLKGLIDHVVKLRHSAALAVDGPRGPIYQVKPGIVKLAEETGLPIYPGAVAAKHRFLFKKAWNRCYLPYPFSRVVIVYGAPLSVPKNATSEELEGLRRELQARMLDLKAEAEAYFDRAFEQPKACQLSSVGV
jgi:lysophospholipid acyltransferase (LPLAT)-like uncharacterized protein